MGGKRLPGASSPCARRGKHAKLMPETPVLFKSGGYPVSTWLATICDTRLVNGRSSTTQSGFTARVLVGLATSWRIAHVFLTEMLRVLDLMRLEARLAFAKQWSARASTLGRHVTTRPAFGNRVRCSRYRPRHGPVDANRRPRLDGRRRAVASRGLAHNVSRLHIVWAVRDGHNSGHTGLSGIVIFLGGRWCGNRWIVSVCTSVLRNHVFAVSTRRPACRCVGYRRHGGRRHGGRSVETRWRRSIAAAKVAGDIRVGALGRGAGGDVQISRRR
jgi:hypothetical protein